MSQRPRIVLSGYYGYDNAGDEAVLAGLVRNLVECGADFDGITALSGDPETTRATQSVNAVDRYGPVDLVRSLSSCDLLLSGGGSLLQDVTSAHGIFYYLAIVRAAQILGKRTMFIAQGLGPLLRPRSRRLVAAVARRLDAITVRDEESAELLKSIGVSGVRTEVTADPALLLGIDRQSGRSRYGVALRPWAAMDIAGRLAEACGAAMPQTEAAVFPMQPSLDTAVSEQFRSAHAGITTMHPAGAGLDALVREISSCKLMIGMRLHGLILAAACGIPSLALSYDPKVSAFMKSTGQEDAVLKMEEPEGLEEMLKRVWTEKDARAEALAARLPGLEAAARRNGEIAMGLIR